MMGSQQEEAASSRLAVPDGAGKELEAESQRIKMNRNTFKSSAWTGGLPLLLLLLCHRLPAALAKGLVGKLPGNPASCPEEPCSSDPQHVLRALKHTSYFVGVIFLMPILLYYLSKLFSKLRELCRATNKTADDNDEPAKAKAGKVAANKKAREGSQASRKSCAEGAPAELAGEKRALKYQAEFVAPSSQEARPRSSGSGGGGALGEHKSGSNTSNSSRSASQALRHSIQLSNGRASVQQQQQHFDSSGYQSLSKQMQQQQHHHYAERPSLSSSAQSEWWRGEASGVFEGGSKSPRLSSSSGRYSGSPIQRAAGRKASQHERQQQIAAAVADEADLLRRTSLKRQRKVSSRSPDSGAAPGPVPGRAKRQSQHKVHPAGQELFDCEPAQGNDDFMDQLEVPPAPGRQHRHSIDGSALNKMLVLAPDQLGDLFEQQQRRRQTGESYPAGQLELNYREQQRRWAELEQLQVSPFLDQEHKLEQDERRARHELERARRRRANGSQSARGQLQGPAGGKAQFAPTRHQQHRQSAAGQLTCQPQRHQPAAHLANGAPPLQLAGEAQNPELA